MKRCISMVICLFSVLLLFPILTQASEPKPSPEDEAGILSIIAGRSKLLNFNGLARVAVGDPRVADVVVISGDDVLLNAKTPGETTLHVWDKSGVRAYLVKVSRNDSEVAATVKELIGLPGVSVKAVGGVILLEGVVDRSEDKVKAEEVAKAYSDKVLSFISEVVVEVIRGTEKSTVSLR